LLDIQRISVAVVGEKSGEVASEIEKLAMQEDKYEGFSLPLQCMDYFFLPHGDEICWIGHDWSPDLATFRLWGRQSSQLGDKWGTVRMESGGRAEERMSGLRLSHGFLVPENIICGGQTWVVGRS
jgi:hypothetical protein